VSRDTLEEAEQDASQLSRPQIGQILQENAALIRKSVDSGEFDSAQFHALRALGVARAFEASLQ
jgi:chorismate-pyruvate lyase